ncbi:MAG: HoxN/HupN/NixA family nickel/cobalt transporter [Acidobacteriaceae bacterium]|nr:HoxN/HupN/NixA family nickel/cobalt transporter [Acidobacteriaceae bacterium]
MNKLFREMSSNLRARIIAIYGVLILFNVAAWLWAVLAFRHHPVLLGTAFLAYSFGLRHAVDADHIAAIDNVTRKLMQEGKRPVAVGFMFSLGHSTIVVIGSVLIASSTLMLQGRLASFRNIGGIVGTAVSMLFLFGIAFINLGVFRSVYKAFVQVHNGAPYVEEDMGTLLAGGGFFARLLRPVFGMIQQSWHMYPLGLLFGLGFDTATEIGLLSISAAEVAKGLPLSSALIFPALFAAGMSLIDTTDNILMIGAYGWAFVKPVRKLYYNMTITLVSVVVALVVGGIEGAGLLADQFQLRGNFWDVARKLNENLGKLGYCIIALFVLSWIFSAVFYRWLRFDEIGDSKSGTAAG